jgi:Flp pilus assembly protein TadD
LELEPENASVHNALSFIYWHKGQTAQALQEAKEALALAPYSIQGHNNLAFAYYARGELDLALETAQQTVKLSPQHDVAHYILGLCYLEQGANAQARAAFEKFLTVYLERAYVRDFKVQAEGYLEQLADE